MLKLEKINKQNKQSVLSLHEKIYLGGNARNALSDTMDMSCHIGFCGFKKTNLVGFVSATYAADELDIIELGVVKDFRRHGVAFKLIVHLQQYCIEHKIQKIYLEVAVNNESAINLYEKTGFNKIGIRKNYYTLKGFTLDAFTYCWNITKS